MRVYNMLSPKTNKPVANQFIISDDDGSLTFQSYDTIIARKFLKDGIVQLDVNAWNYSRTTSKYRSQFLKESTAETEKKIKAGIYVLTNLN